MLKKWHLPFKHKDLNRVRHKNSVSSFKISSLSRHNFTFDNLSPDIDTAQTDNLPFAISYPVCMHNDVLYTEPCFYAWAFFDKHLTKSTSDSLETFNAQFGADFLKFLGNESLALDVAHLLKNVMKQDSVETYQIVLTRKGVLVVSETPQNKPDNTQVLAAVMNKNITSSHDTLTTIKQFQSFATLLLKQNFQEISAERNLIIDIVPV
jgi:hypothetical protein